MASTYDFAKLRRLTTIHLVVQVFLLVLLAGATWQFLGRIPADSFMNSIIRTVVIQLLLFYPIYRFASADAEREAEASARGLSSDQANALRRKRVFSDIVKGAIIIFFFVFTLRAPSAPPVQFSIIAIFLLSYLAYFQCFNFSAKRKMKELGV